MRNARAPPRVFRIEWKATERRDLYVAMNPERVRALRNLRGMSKRELAAEAGVSETTARRAERGEPV